MGKLQSRRTKGSGKPSTLGHKRLDINALSHSGAFTPGKKSLVIWGDEDNPAAEVLAIMHSQRPEMQLSYSFFSSDGQALVVREAFRAESETLAGGGLRWYLLCLGCEKRRTVMYMRGGRFRCRRCHGMNHETTRTSEVDLAILKMRRLQHRLGGDNLPFSTLPPKPPGMWHKTYMRLADEFLAAQKRHMELCMAMSR
jgi:hypothetical protein